MAIQEKINANPTVYAVSATASKKYDEFDATTDEETVDPFEADEVFGECRFVLFEQWSEG
jgi:hypothetical protein